MNAKLLRLNAVIDWTGLSRSTIYAMMQNGNFPKNHLLGARAVGWLSSDIEAWIDSRTNAIQA
jgi:prophage regulatory protein